MDWGSLPLVLNLVPWLNKTKTVKNHIKKQWGIFSKASNYQGKYCPDGYLCSKLNQINCHCDLPDSGLKQLSVNGSPLLENTFLNLNLKNN